jgi:arginine-tRNA-protein transferase
MKKLLETKYQEHWSASDLDYYLSRGWFRMGAGMSRHPILTIEGQVDSVVNVRIQTFDTSKHRRAKKLLAKNNLFKVVISPYSYSEDIEPLYQQTSVRFKGYIHSSFYDYMHFNQMIEKPFDSMMIKVFDKKKLIAFSLFDAGNQSIMSILGLHHDEYKKFSLGKFTMYQEIDYAFRNRLKWYYPGYVLSRNKTFHYKLDLAPEKTFTKICNSAWIKNRDLEKIESIGEQFENMNQQLSLLLSEVGIPHQTKVYPFFALKENLYLDALFDLPQLIILNVSPHSAAFKWIAAFDVLQNRFIVCKARIYPQSFSGDARNLKELSNPRNFHDIIFIKKESLTFFESAQQTSHYIRYATQQTPAFESSSFDEFAQLYGF